MISKLDFSALLKLIYCLDRVDYVQYIIHTNNGDIKRRFDLPVDKKKF